MLSTKTKSVAVVAALTCFLTLSTIGCDAFVSVSVQPPLLRGLAKKSMALADSDSDSGSDDTTGVTVKGAIGVIKDHMRLEGFFEESAKVSLFIF